ncbi:MAG TPA: flagellar assembly protein FliW [Bryobacteraceae bacterium]|nr:flagellar assembly protein FliW [Bryobacteraceae bacterium]
MSSVETKYFGVLPYAEESVFNFPLGLPAFEDEKAFVLIETVERAPLVFLQSLSRPSLCFLAFPVQIVDRNYPLAVAPEDLDALGLDPGRQPALSAEVVVLALISVHDGFVATANLMAPVVLNVKNRRGVQAIRRDRLYSHQHPVSLKPEAEQTAPKGQPC